MSNRLAALVALVCTVGLLGAIDLSPRPVVVVYPFQITGDAAPDVGGRLAVALAEGLAESDQLVVKPATPGVDYAKYLDDARRLDADYYVAGYATTLGPDVSLVIQVVSPRTGAIIWSETVDARTYADVQAQDDIVRQAILSDANRGRAISSEAPATPAPI
ncbi:MAG: hypothetical protein ACREM8_15380, partial [Vulcanimicrobiaceae bacterium]